MCSSRGHANICPIAMASGPCQPHCNVYHPTWNWKPTRLRFHGFHEENSSSAVTAR